jgi:ribonuclease Z
MTGLFLPHLVNGPTGDPALYVNLRWQRRALLFDLGDLAPLATPQILRVSHMFVSHAHMDHFFGFDRVLRFHLPRPTRLHLFGPAGIIDRVRGRLGGYTWNLTGSYPFVLEVTEVTEDALRSVTLPARDGFAVAEENRAPFTGTLLDEPLLRVDAALLDHAIPCLAFALQEKDHVHIDPNALARLGLRAGPWLGSFKTAVREGCADAQPIPVEERGLPRGEATRPLGELRGLVARVDPGVRLAYVTDALYHAENARRIVALAHGTAVLYCEAMFLEKDAALAAERFHLTAVQAGALARRAGAHSLEVFHVSSRYSQDPEAVIAEAQSAFRGKVRLAEAGA